METTVTGSRSHIVVGVVPGHAADIVATAAMFARQFDADLICANVNASRYTATFDLDGTVVSLPLIPDRTEGRREQFDPDLHETIAATLADTGVA